MDFLRDEGVAFTGHRTYTDEANEPLREHVERLSAEGFRHFLTGMAEGFDLAAAEAVLAVRQARPVRLICVVPFPGQAKGFSPQNLERYRAILEEADEVITTAPAYHRGCFLRRNDFLIEHAAHLIAYYNGEPKGGTHYTVKRAQKYGLPIENLYHERAELFPPKDFDKPEK